MRKSFFFTPNWICRWRGKNFLRKEPETISWINDFQPCSVFWDIGANVGEFSIYASKFKKCSSFAFEPSVFNLEVLARNIFSNDLQEAITIVPLAVGAATGTNTLYMSNTEIGGAFSSVGEPLSSGGKKLETCFQLPTVAVSLDDALEKLGLPQPDHLKIDVDGLEHRVLEGGTKCLKRVKSVLVEMTPGYQPQEAVIEDYMGKAGLMRRSKPVNGQLGLRPGSENVIWVRK